MCRLEDVEDLCTWALPSVSAPRCLRDLFQASHYGHTPRGSAALWPVMPPGPGLQKALVTGRGLSPAAADFLTSGKAAAGCPALQLVLETPPKLLPQRLANADFARLSPIPCYWRQSLSNKSRLILKRKRQIFFRKEPAESPAIWTHQRLRTYEEVDPSASCQAEREISFPGSNWVLVGFQKHKSSFPMGTFTKATHKVLGKKKISFFPAHKPYLKY